MKAVIILFKHPEEGRTAAFSMLFCQEALFTVLIWKERGE